jgi:nicotinate phosphoribosyltransferase
LMIIESMIDNDLYKFTMLQAVLHQHPGAMVEYEFKCRTEGIDFRAYSDKIIGEVNKMCRELRFTKEELEYLGDLRFMKKDTIQFLKLFRFDYNFVEIITDVDGELHIHIKGPWLHTILFEVPILSIVSEIYSRDMSNNFEEANNRTKEKISFINEMYKEEGIPLLWADFGGRRRHSVEAHRNALVLFKEGCLASRDKTGLVGTSNVMMAKEQGIKPIGTMAHEWGQAHQALYRIAESQFMALENWSKEYRGDLGIALSDVIGLKYFLHDFDLFFSKLFDGTRQDSGDPYLYGSLMIKHYKNMGIDPKTKTIVFSDGLDFFKAIVLARTFNGEIKVSFGIGTHVTNDFNFKALQIVLKMVSCNGNPVAKISDTPTKGMCNDEGYVDYLQRVFDNRISRK